MMAMKSKVISSSVPHEVVKKLMEEANCEGMSLSRFIRSVLEDAVGDACEITKEEIERRLEECKDATNCIVHKSVEALIQSLSERSSRNN
jgi:hypothetical protein